MIDSIAVELIFVLMKPKIHFNKRDEPQAWFK